MSGAFEMMKSNAGIFSDIEEIGCTGGGAYRYGEEFQKVLDWATPMIFLAHIIFMPRTSPLLKRFNVKVVKYDEMQCLLTGLNFLLKRVPDEVFVFEGGIQSFADPRPFVQGNPLERRTLEHVDGDSLYPYLLVNVGSGISFLRCLSIDKFERVMGSAIGGATFWGLVKSMTKIRDYDEALRLAQEGNSDSVNMTVGDIYGGDYPSFSLPRNMTASFFGKVIHSYREINPHNKVVYRQQAGSHDPPLEGASDADIWCVTRLLPFDF
ncbi:hypothetical protein HDU93_009622 [Gonapodya sp. JEL0774]|nr:hypothetical protein HDU93_009622 [Gonapodya sp. JEL0774]